MHADSIFSFFFFAKLIKLMQFFRNKREDIAPSKVQPILSTEGPWINEIDSTITSNEGQEDLIISTLEQDLQSSLVTVTETITQTVTEYCSK